MDIVALFLLAVCFAMFIVLLVQKMRMKKAQKAWNAEKTDMQNKIDTLIPLKRYEHIPDAEQELSRVREQIKEEREAADQELSHVKTQCQGRIELAEKQANEIIANGQKEAKRIAGKAVEISGHIDDLKREEQAIINRINGYGDEYIVPAYSLLDELAEEMAFTETGTKLKEIRAKVRQMTTSHQAAKCSYVMAERRDIAITFVTDAFNGKVETVMSKVKADNYGKLCQEIKDAYELVNKNGRAFRDAVIAPEYLNLRIEELKWACAAQEIRRQKQEEQRALREKMKEEEKAQREIEKALKDAQKEREMYHKALEKARAEQAAAEASKQAAFEKKIQELEQKAKEAEEKNKRAESMAQQTKRGNVYIISNIGSFGEGIYKIGMTRRLVPEDRIKELGDASVPFPFDIHAMIECDDAPALETELHRTFIKDQVNKVNPRKEYYRTSLASIRHYVESKGLQVSWTLNAAAAEYRETLSIEKAMKEDPMAQKQWEKDMEMEVAQNAYATIGA